MTTAIYAFSGDPITYGHIDIIKRANKVFDQVIVAIGENPDKQYTFNLREREEMARRCFSYIADAAIRVMSFSNLLVDFAYEQGADVIIKGVRNSADFDYENVLHSVGQSQKIGIDTHILFADPELSHVSSSAVKGIVKHGGDIHEYVPLHVKEYIEKKICKQMIIGVTGEICAGKSHICKTLVNECKSSGPYIHNIELDNIGHDILNKLTDPGYVLIREQIKKEFGSEVMMADGFIDRKKLGDIVFDDHERLGKLNKIMEKPIMVRLRQEISGKEGMILINCALLAESDMLHICNNNVMLVTINQEELENRLTDRGYTKRQRDKRVSCQYDEFGKTTAIYKKITDSRHGKLWAIDNTNGLTDDEICEAFEKVTEDMANKYKF